MAELFQSERVRYLCACGLLKPLCLVYFCRHCIKMRCANCVSHEVDSTFCTGCLEMMSITEAGHKKNRCSSCKVCPCCNHLLSTRATSVQAPSLEDPTKLVPKKVYYVACGFCRWTSRDSKLPDQNVASGCWCTFENEHADRIGVLSDCYRSLAAVEKAEKEQKRYARPDANRRYLEGKDKFGLSARATRKKAGLPPSRSHAPIKDMDASALLKLRAEPAEHVEELDDSFITAPVVLASVTSLEQRLSFVELQPELSCQLQPQYKHVELKRSLRCRYCDHNLSKPEYSVINIKFRIQLNAYYHVPDIRIQSVGDLVPGRTVDVLLTFTNPTSHPMPVWLESYYDPGEEELKENPDPDHREASLLRVVTLERVVPDMSCSADLEVSGTKFVLAPRDDSAEFDDAPSVYEHKDDPSVVAWRQSNKVAIRCRVTPHATSIDGASAVVALVVNYRYTNAIVTAESRTPRLLDLRARVLINLGTIQQ